MNVGLLSQESIEKYGEFDSCVFDGQNYSNVERDAYAARLATVLKGFGVGIDTHVIVMMPNSPVVTATFQALWKLGAVMIPVAPMLNPREVGFLIENSETRVVLTLPVLAARLHEATKDNPNFDHLLVIGETEVEGTVNIEPQIEGADAVAGYTDRAESDLAMLLYTSGTTGNPKGVMLTHGNLVSNAKAASQFVNIEPKMSSLLVLPLSHSFGVLMMNLGLVLGTRYVLLTHFDTESVFKAIQEHKVERFSVVPTMLTYMINYADREKYDVSSLVSVNSGAAALLNEVRLEFERLFDCEVKEGYGLSETSPVLTSYPDADAYRPGSVGRAIPGVEVIILDADNNPVAQGVQGEICAKGPNVMQGYWKLPEATAEAMVGGWFHSGDIGYMDADGFVYITDRKKDLIIKGGENISPREIEEAVQKHPSVAEAAVVGIKDLTFGENILAVIALKPGKTATEDEIKEHIGTLVTKFKIPGRVEFSPMLPKNATGKIQKRLLRDIYSKVFMPAADAKK